MNNKVETTTYVLIPEEVAQYLDQDETACPSFTFSSMTAEDESGVPAREEVQAIETRELSSSELNAFRKRGEIDRTVYPLVTYYPQVMGVELMSKLARSRSRAAPAKATSTLRVQVRERKSGEALAGVTVVAFWGADESTKAQSVTDANGVVVLTTAKLVQQLVVLPAHTHWSHVKAGVKVTDSVETVELDAINPCTATSLNVVRKTAVACGRGKGVKVAIIDSGVGPHSDIHVASSKGPLSEPDSSGEDSNLHGTHVAGIVAGTGAFPGVAPECEIWSYRVSRPEDISITNADLVSAIFEAVRDGCHIINLSLGALEHDPLVEKTVKQALREGVLVVAAAGNDGLRRIHSPAKVKGVVSVAAMGTKSTYPADSMHVTRECLPKGTNEEHYIANFSNRGKSLRCVAPGVGVVSTVPGGYLALDGTSMAAPVVTGIAACLLSAAPEILKMKANLSRTKAISELLYTACNTLGFPVHMEGENGLPS